MTESPVKWSFEELQIKLPEQLTIRCSRKKENEAKKKQTKKKQLLDRFWKYLQQKLSISNCFCLSFLYELSPSTSIEKQPKQNTKVILIFLYKDDLIGDSVLTEL